MNTNRRLQRIEADIARHWRAGAPAWMDTLPDRAACGEARERLRRAAGLTDRERWVWALYIRGFLALVGDRAWHAFCRLHELSDEQRRAWSEYFTAAARVRTVEWREMVDPRLTSSREANERILADAREVKARRLAELADRARSELGPAWDMLSDEDRRVLSAVYYISADARQNLAIENAGIENAEGQALLESASDKILTVVRAADTDDLRAACLHGVRGLLRFFGDRFRDRF